MKRWTLVLAGLLGVVAMVALAAWMAVGYMSVAGIETPAYEVEEVKDGYEVRRYAPHIAAEVTVEGDFDASMNRGFRSLADYIFGNNAAADGEKAEIAMTAPVQERSAKGEKIAMTAPVQEQAAPDGDEARIVSFVMPSEYTMETLPKPNNPDVRIVEVPEKRFAVLSFSGRAPEAKSQEKKAELTGKLAADGLKAVGEPILCQYDPPWTPPFMRKNEVWIEIASEG